MFRFLDILTLTYFSRFTRKHQAKKKIHKSHWFLAMRLHTHKGVIMLYPIKKYKVKTEKEKKKNKSSQIHITSQEKQVIFQ